MAETYPLLTPEMLGRLQSMDDAEYQQLLQALDEAISKGGVWANPEHKERIMRARETGSPNTPPQWVPKGEEFTPPPATGIEKIPPAPRRLTGRDKLKPFPGGGIANIPSTEEALTAAQTAAARGRGKKAVEYSHLPPQTVDGKKLLEDSLMGFSNLAADQTSYAIGEWLMGEAAKRGIQTGESEPKFQPHESLPYPPKLDYRHKGPSSTPAAPLAKGKDAITWTGDRVAVDVPEHTGSFFYPFDKDKQAALTNFFLDLATKPTNSLTDTLRGVAEAAKGTQEYYTALKEKEASRNAAVQKRQLEFAKTSAEIAKLRAEAAGEGITGEIKNVNKAVDWLNSDSPALRQKGTMLAAQILTEAGALPNASDLLTSIGTLDFASPDAQALAQELIPILSALGAEAAKRTQTALGNVSETNGKPTPYTEYMIPGTGIVRKKPGK